MAEPLNPPMGCLDAFDVGAKKLTVQTEFFSRPTWRIETKIYLGGELKKLFTDDLAEADEPLLQRRVNEFHQARIAEMREKLQAKKP